MKLYLDILCFVLAHVTRDGETRDTRYTRYTRDNYIQICHLYGLLKNTSETNFVAIKIKIFLKYLNNFCV